MTGPEQPESEHCECPIRHDYPRKIASCNAESPEERLCSRPDGHDGPHAACAPNAHPVETWEDDGLRADGSGEPQETGRDRNEYVDLARFALEIDLGAIDVLPTAGGMNDSPVKRHTDVEGIRYV